MILSPEEPKTGEVLNNFYTKLISSCNEKKNSVIEYFNEPGNLNTKITLNNFNNVLNNLGYDDQSDDLGLIIKKYQDKFETNYIDLEAIENDLKEFKNKPIQQNIFTQNPSKALKILLDPFASMKNKEENKNNNENNEKNENSQKIDNSNLNDNNNNDNLNNNNNKSEINKQSSIIENNNSNINDSSTNNKSNLNPYIDIIKEKIENEKKRINSELNSTPEYELCLIYNKIYKKCKEGQMINIFENQFYNKDQSLTGYISYTDFINILDNTILLSNREIEILFNDIDLIKIENKEEEIKENFLKPYKKFLEKIRQNNEEQIRTMKYEYNLNYNIYINNIRNDIKKNNIDLRDFWAKIFKGNLTCNKNEFNLIFNEGELSGQYHPLEIEYIFDLLTDKKEKLSYKTFVEIMNRNVDLNERELKLINKDKSIYNPTVEDPDQKVYSVIYNKPLNEEEKQNELKNKLENERNDLINNVTNKIANIIKENENNENKENEKENEKENVNEEIPIINNPNIKIIQHNKEILEITNPSNFKQSEIRNIYKYNEIKELDVQSKINLIESRIYNYSLKVNLILNEHEEYCSLKLLKYLYNNFKNMGNEPNIYLKKKDFRNVGRLSLGEIHYVLTENLHIKNIDLDILKIILNSLNDKDTSNSFFNYSEFLKKIYHFPYLYEGKENKIYRIAQFNFNEYLLDFKRFIKYNNINYLKIFNYLWKNNNDLNHLDEKKKKNNF